MTNLIHRLRGILIALAVLALSASLAFGAQPDGKGLTNAAAHAGKTVPVQAGDEETTGDESSEGAGDNCTIDPTLLTPEDLAALKHGSVVCWAAQQTEWPEWFSNHGSFVKCWAHQGKADAISCTEDPTAAGAEASTTHGKGKGKGHNK